MVGSPSKWLAVLAIEGILWPVGVTVSEEVIEALYFLLVYTSFLLLGWPKGCQKAPS